MHRVNWATHRVRQQDHRTFPKWCAPVEHTTRRDNLAGDHLKFSLVFLGLAIKNIVVQPLLDGVCMYPHESGRARGPCTQFNATRGLPTGGARSCGSCPASCRLLVVLPWAHMGHNPCRWMSNNSAMESLSFTLWVPRAACATFGSHWQHLTTCRGTGDEFLVHIYNWKSWVCGIKIVLRTSEKTMNNLWIMCDLSAEKTMNNVWFKFWK